MKKYILIVAVTTTLENVLLPAFAVGTVLGVILGVIPMEGLVVLILGSLATVVICSVADDYAIKGCFGDEDYPS